MIFRNLLVALLVMPCQLWAQSGKLVLGDAVRMAQNGSIDYKISRYTAQLAYWDHQAYRARFFPKLSLGGTLPNYYRTINPITLPNGQVDFVGQNVASSGVNVSLSQNVGLTGGTVSVGSSLQRVDNFGNFKNSAYNTVPFTISYTQSTLLYNDLKWQRRIQPIRLEESSRLFRENLEEIALNTVYKYFDLLKAQVQYKLDKQNQANIDTLVKITQARSEIGTVQLNELLQSKVSLLNAQKSALASGLALQTARNQLIIFLNLDKNLPFDLEVPDSCTFFQIDQGMALAEALTNRKFVTEFKRRRLQAEQEIARVKAENGPAVNVRANLGLTQRGTSLKSSYQEPFRNQSVEIGFYIPLLDWNVGRSNRKRAEANMDLEMSTIAQQQLSAEQEVIYQVMKWNMQENQLEIARLTRQLAQQRYEMARQKYAVGAITYTDFTNAQIEKDSAEMDYLNSVFSYWISFYLIRKLTLYDFLNKQKLEAQPAKVQK